MKKTDTSITVYSKPSCVQCNMTTKFLEKSNRPYVKIDVTEDDAAFKYVTEELGYLQVPVVTTSGGDNWSGFRPDRLAEFV